MATAITIQAGAAINQPKLKEQTRLASDISRMTAVRPQRSDNTPPPMLPAMLRK